MPIENKNNLNFLLFRFTNNLFLIFYKGLRVLKYYFVGYIFYYFVPDDMYNTRETSLLYNSFYFNRAALSDPAVVKASRVR